MLPQALFVLTLALGAFAASSAESAHSSASSGASSAGSSSSGIGTPTNSAQLPSLSGVSSCVTNCLEVAAGAAGCESEVAVNCFCVTPKNYTTTLLSCLNACPSEVATAETLVEQFCAAASTPTSLSFASFTPSSSASTPASASSKSNSNSGTTSSATSPPSSSSASSSASAPPSTGAAAAISLPLAAILTSAAGVVLGALVAL